MGAGMLEEGTGGENVRLIDADARVTVQSFDAMNEEYNHDEMTVEQALDFATDERCPPTIDAIPVDWLREKMRGYASTLKSTELSAVVRVMQMWDKEQEER